MGYSKNISRYQVQILGQISGQISGVNIRKLGRGMQISKENEISYYAVFQEQKQKLQVLLERNDGGLDLKSDLFPRVHRGFIVDFLLWHERIKFTASWRSYVCIADVIFVSFKWCRGRRGKGYVKKTERNSVSSFYIRAYYFLCIFFFFLQRARDPTCARHKILIFANKPPPELSGYRASGLLFTGATRHVGSAERTRKEDPGGRRRPAPADASAAGQRNRPRGGDDRKWEKKLRGVIFTASSPAATRANREKQ